MDILIEDGYNTEIPSKKNGEAEADTDIVATFEQLKTIFYVQAKHHKTKTQTSSWAVNQITAYKAQQEKMDDGYHKIGWVVSTAESFTEECVNLAKDNDIILLNGNDFAEMLINVGLNSLEEL